MTKLSVIVPVYNVEKYLGDSLDSLLAQSFKDMEVILINDGSRDNSGKILRAYKEKDARIVLIEKPNGGVDTARNAGLDAAKGEYIAFYDPDDTADRTLYAKLIRSMEENASQLAVCGYKTVSTDGQSDEITLDIPATSTRHEHINGFLENHNYICWTLWNKVFVKKIIDENNIRFKSHDEIFAEDVLFNLEYVVNIDSISHVPESLYIYKNRPFSIMSTYVEEYSDKICRYVITTDDFLKNKNLRQVTKEAFCRHAYNYVITAMKLVKCDSRKGAVKYQSIRKTMNNAKIREILSGFSGEDLSLKGRILHFLYKKRLPLLAYTAIMLFVSRENLCPECGNNLEQE